MELHIISGSYVAMHRIYYNSNYFNQTPQTLTMPKETTTGENYYMLSEIQFTSTRIVSPKTDEDGK
jgi:hypothetical protein